MKAGRRLILTLTLALSFIVTPLPAQAAPTAGVFFTTCQFARFNQVDPIVAPGVKPTAHNHVFAGNTNITEFTTTENIQDSGTTCDDMLDKSGYWQPTLIAPNGSTVTPSSINAYYRNFANTVTTAFPVGFRALDSRADYDCGNGSPKRDLPYDCATYPGRFLRTSVTFASCWDGVNLGDTGDHRSHTDFPRNGVCSSPDYPVTLPRLTFLFRYPTVVDGRGYTLSSGALTGLHGDFFNGWDQARLQHLVDVCLNGANDCRHADEVA